MDRYGNQKPDVVDDIIFEDSETFKGPSGATFKNIILEQYRRCCIEGARDMSAESGVFKRWVNGQLIEVAVPNQKDIFMNSVEMLKISLLPRFKKDEKLFGHYLDTFNKNMDTLISDHHKRINNLNDFYKNKLDRVEFSTQYNLEMKKENVNFENMQLAIYRNLLIGMSFLMDHLKYFEEEGVMV